MSIHGIIFDMDGTLGDTFPLIFAAFRAGFKTVGRVYSDTEITQLFGPTETGIFKKISPDRWQDCQTTYLREYEKFHAEKAYVYPGITDILKFLKQHGVKLGIVTGKSPESAAISLRYFGIADFFHPVESGSETSANKPEGIRKTLAAWKLSPHEVAYLGDAPYDVSAARETGVMSLSAAWGSLTDLPLIAKEKPAQIFTQVQAFSDWVRQEIQR
jgi:pyrophosphatase PpaX